jgi:hypothetical protein
MMSDLVIAKPICRWVCWVVAAAVVLAILAGIYLVYRFTQDRAEAKRRSGDAIQIRLNRCRQNSIPMRSGGSCGHVSEYMPRATRTGLGRVGFIYDEATGRSWPVPPISTSFRNYMGVNASSSTARSVTPEHCASANGERRVYLGMPANRIDLQAFQDLSSMPLSMSALRRISLRR